MDQAKFQIEVAPGPASNPQPHFRQVEAIYDPEVATMTLPKELVHELGLRTVGHRHIRVGRRERKVELVGPLWVQFGGRRAYTDAVVKPGKVRLGFSPRVEMDLIVKETGELQPRDPKGIAYFVR